MFKVARRFERTQKRGIMAMTKDEGRMTKDE